MAKSHPRQSCEAVHSESVHCLECARNKITAGFAVLACGVALTISLQDSGGASLMVSAIEDVQGWGAQEPPSRPAPAVRAPVAIDPNLGKYRAIGDYLARRYGVSTQATTDIVATVHAVGQKFKLDPMLILAVISIESRFNPIAESTMGAKGLMQVIPRFHADKFKPLGGTEAAFNPEANITVGTSILKDYMRRTGDVEGALQLYVGATSEESENGYSSKVMSERDRLNQVLQQYMKRSKAAPEKDLALRPSDPTT